MMTTTRTRKMSGTPVTTARRIFRLMMTPIPDPLVRPPFPPPLPRALPCPAAHRHAVASQGCQAAWDLDRPAPNMYIHIEWC